MSVGAIILSFAVVIGVINALGAVVSATLGLFQTLKSRASFACAPMHCLPFDERLPFVSIHVAAHDEPPALLIDTLTALNALDYPAFEVIIIDNNTPNRRTWQPVERHVAKLGKRFHFVHKDDVEGAKAGALNIALGMTDQRARYVAIVDADYQVSSDFLLLATAACVGIDFVQFPQSYRLSDGAEAVCGELSDYFSVFPSAANRSDASLLTGTLSLISISALRRVGGWPTSSITEDAELGVMLWDAGARGRFINRVVGTGLLPLDLAGLRQQRGRWAAGNVQTLIRALASSNIVSRPGGLAVLAQLTAWTGFLAAPLAILCLIAGFRLSGWQGDRPLAMAEAIATATLAFSLASIGLRAIATGRTPSLAVTMSMLWTSSFSWLPALSGTRLKFRRTPKAVIASSFGGISIDMAASLVALLLAAIFAGFGSLVTTIVLMASASGLVTGRLVDRTLRSTAKAYA